MILRMNYSLTLSSLILIFLVGCSSLDEKKDKIHENEILNIDDEYQAAYATGIEIAEGLSLGIFSGMTNVDPDAKYSLVTKKDIFKHENYTWPIIDVSIVVKSNILKNPTITYVIFLEQYKNTKFIGTIKNIKVDNEIDENLNTLLNTMYLSDSEGVKQVSLDQLGNLVIID